MTKKQAAGQRSQDVVRDVGDLHRHAAIDFDLDQHLKEGRQAGRLTGRRDVEVGDQFFDVFGPRDVFGGGSSRSRSFSAGEPRMTMSLALRSSQVKSRLRLTRIERPAR